MKKAIYVLLCLSHSSLQARWFRAYLLLRMGDPNEVLKPERPSRTQLKRLIRKAAVLMSMGQASEQVSSEMASAARAFRTRAPHRLYRAPKLSLLSLLLWVTSSQAIRVPLPGVRLETAGVSVLLVTHSSWSSRSACAIRRASELKGLSQKSTFRPRTRKHWSMYHWRLSLSAPSTATTHAWNSPDLTSSERRWRRA